MGEFRERDDVAPEPTQDGNPSPSEWGTEIDLDQSRKPGAIPGAPRRRRTSRTSPTDRDSLTRLSPADPELIDRLQRIWDDAAQDAVRLAQRFESIAPSWRDLECENADEDQVEVETLALAVALRCTRGIADRLVRDAHTATTQFLRTFERLRTGEFPASWFERLLQRTRHLEAHDLDVVDTAAALWPMSITTEQFQRRLSLLLTRLESRREEPAHLTPEGRRRVELMPPRDDGIGCLQVIGPIPEILSLARRLDASARAVQDSQRHALEAGEQPPLDLRGTVTEKAMPAPLTQLEYDLLMGALLDTDGVPVPTDRFRFNVTVPALTLLGASQEPGMLEGTIPLPPEMARELAGSNPIWHRVLTDPATGEFLPLPADRYRPTQAMLEHLRLRHATCAVPGCTRPASWASECDHIEEYDHLHPERGGLTSIDNLHLLCWQHHRAKTAGLLDPARLPRLPGIPGGTEWSIAGRARLLVRDDTDLATPATVRELLASWKRHREKAEARRRAARKRKEPPSPPPPPPF